MQDVAFADSIYLKVSLFKSEFSKQVEKEKEKTYTGQHNMMKVWERILPKRAYDRVMLYLFVF
jgi:hypothetical protein